jgi:hypothetical protein
MNVAYITGTVMQILENWQARNSNAFLLGGGYWLQNEISTFIFKIHVYWDLLKSGKLFTLFSTTCLKGRILLSHESSDLGFHRCGLKLT